MKVITRLWVLVLVAGLMFAAQSAGRTTTATISSAGSMRLLQLGLRFAF